MRIGAPPEVTHVRVQRLGAGHRQDDRAEQQEAVEPVTEQRAQRVARQQRPHDARLAQHLGQAQGADRGEPEQHHRAEQLAELRGALGLDQEQPREQHARHRNHEVRELGVEHLQALDRAEHRDRRRERPVPVQQSGADQDENRDATGLPRRGALEGARQQGQQREDPALTVVVGPHDDGEVLDRDDQRQRPEDQRRDAQSRVDRLVDPLGGQRLPHRVQRRRADVAEDHPRGPHDQRGGGPLRGMPSGVRMLPAPTLADLRDAHLVRMPRVAPMGRAAMQPATADVVAQPLQLSGPGLLGTHGARVAPPNRRIPSGRASSLRTAAPQPPDLRRNIRWP